MKRGQAIVSTISEWERFGKPVLAQNIARKDTKVFTKMTLRPLSKTLCEGYVTRDIRDKLKSGQSIFVDAEGGRVWGAIRSVGQALNVDTGMFQVRVAFERGFGALQHSVVGYIHTGTIKNVISVPNEVIDTEDKKTFVWKIQDGYALRQPVVLGERNGFSAVVLDGLRDGDMVVIAGQTQLSDKERVQIVGHREVVGGER
jgi:multidrug efflux pump subunit AcrA (membrane-fusion protein)